jgi:transposase InsO family protein
MSREAHVRFCERLREQFPRSTRPVVESFFHSLKVERIHGKHYPTREAAKSDIFNYIEIFYNKKRLHSTLDYCSPVEYEQQYWSKQVA